MTRFDDPRNNKKREHFVDSRPSGGHNRTENIISDDDKAIIEELPQKLQEDLEKIKTGGYAKMAEDSGFMEWMVRKQDELMEQFSDLKKTYRVVNEERNTLERRLASLDRDQRELEDKAEDTGLQIGIRKGIEQTYSKLQPKIKEANKEVLIWKVLFWLSFSGIVGMFVVFLIKWLKGLI